MKKSNVTLNRKINKLLLIDEFMYNQRTWVLCLCDCGNFKEACYSDITSNKIKSCGCYRIENTRKMRKRHGESNETSEYISWRGMKQRCYNKNLNQYNDWGGRGITVCDRWLNSFENFLEDMGRKPTPKHSIDRIDNDGNYEPGNCRWATKSQQAYNRKKKQLNYD